MLHFFRKYQKIFFIIVTCAVVVSFLFFGTYQAMAPAAGGRGEDEKSYPAKMASFLDTEYWMISRRLFTENFLNDGVISKEFLETGMADMVAAAFPQRFEKDFRERCEREKSYQPYTHPYLPSLSANSLWSIFAPEIPKKLKKMQENQGGFKERTELFLAQKECPAAFLSQIIRYQEQNNPQMPPDPRIARDDAALFSYRTLTDWYGEAFMETLASIIIKSADLARKQGFKVSKEELLAELVTRSQDIYRGLKQKVDLPVEDGYGLFQLYLRQNGLTEETALEIWEDVTLFRRLMHCVGDAALVDSLALSQFYSYAFENVLVEVIQMTQDCRLASMEELKHFETYLAAVGDKKSSALDIPLNYAPVATIEERAPELVGKRYQLYFAHISKSALQAKASIKETLQWQCDAENWKVLQKQFPELAKATSQPFDALEQLDEKTRKLVDSFSRTRIVELHPEWIQESLVACELKEKNFFHSSASASPFEGITHLEKLIAALETQDELMCYTQDEQHYYRFLVKDKGSEKIILTFREALHSNRLEKLSERLKGDSLVKAVVDATPQNYKALAHTYRFASFIKKYRDASPEGELAKQFSIEKKEKTITRSERSFIPIDTALAMAQGVFSEVNADTKEGAYLFRFLEKRGESTIPFDKIMKTQEMLSKEARCRYFEKILAQLPHAG